MKKICAVLVLMVISYGVPAGHPAFAHSFLQIPDADMIAKIQEFKVESKLIANNISNSTLAQWHVSKSMQYWGANELDALGQNDSSLSTRMSSSIDDLYSLVAQQSTDQNGANQKADALNLIFDQAETEMISSSSSNNATVQALALADIVNEVLRDYGTAIGSTTDLTNMNNMNMTVSGTSAGSTQGMSGMSGMSSSKPIRIVNMGAYQSAEALTDTAQSMFGNLQSISPVSASSYLTKVGSALSELKQKIDSQSSGNDVMTVAHMQIHPNLIAAFDIAAVPEFPMPVLLVMTSFVGVIALSRIFYRK